MRRSLQAFVWTLLAIGGGLLTGTTLVQEAAARVGEGYVGLDVLARAMHTIESRHVQEVSTEALVADAVGGMADGLDLHTRYLDAETWQSMQRRTEGERAGELGLRLEWVMDLVVRVAAVTPGGPAALAGILPGDLVEAPAGSAWDADSVSQLAEQYRGAIGSTVVVEVRRADQLLQLSVVRDTVREPATHPAMLEPGVGYVRLVHFQRESANDLVASLADLDQDGPLRGLVLDLRGNGGGLLEEAVAMLDLFISEGDLARVEGRVDAEREHFVASATTPRAELPLVIIVDRGSASASELLAGSFQAHGRATLVGTRTYGKGSVQRVYPFEDGSALKLTVARYTLRGGVSIEDGRGLQPDVLVHRAASASAALADLELAVAGLASDERERFEALLPALRSEFDPEPVPVAWRLPPAERVASDVQLAAALRLLQDQL